MEANPPLMPSAKATVSKVTLLDDITSLELKLAVHVAVTVSVPIKPAVMLTVGVAVVLPS